MATLKSIMAADASILIDTDDFGESSSYTPKSTGEAAPIEAEWLYGDYEAEFEDAGRSDKRTAEVMVKKADVSKPERGDQIDNADGETFVIMRTLRSDDVFHVVSAVEKTRKTLGDLSR